LKKQAVDLQTLTDTSTAMQIFIKMLNGKGISVDIDHPADIHRIKAIIAAQEGIPVNQQQLMFDLEPLDSCLALGDYGVHDGDEVTLTLLKTEPTIGIEVDMRLEGRWGPVKLYLEVPASRSIEELIQQISDEYTSLYSNTLDFSENCFTYNDTRLDAGTVGDNDIQDGAVIVREGWTRVMA
jgi:hypothetical protein